MVKPDDMLLDEQRLRKALHDKIDQLGRDRLSLLNQVVLQLEVEKLADELDGAFDRDRQQGALANERIRQAIARHRSEHPYQA